jgi:REP element-mobilizing transposase RayT
MPRRDIPLLPGYYYHLYNRGHNRAPIFFQPENYVFFLGRLRKYVATEHAHIVTYALLPNHYHLLLQAHTDDLSHAMQLFGISYTKAINKRFQRTGALFQGAFRAKLVDRDEYLLHLSRYIHLNPVRAGLVQRPEEWIYSSYRDYIGLRNGSLPHPGIVLDQFASREDYQAFVEAYMEKDRDTIAHLLFT